MKPIDAENVVKNLTAMKESLGVDAISIDAMIDGLLNKEPTIEAEPVRHGRWERKHQKKEFPEMHILINGTYPTCSVCGFAEMGISQETNYCPNCGAIMDEVSE